MKKLKLIGKKKLLRALTIGTATLTMLSMLAGCGSSAQNSAKSSGTTAISKQSAATSATTAGSTAKTTASVAAGSAETGSNNSFGALEKVVVDNSEYASMDMETLYEKAKQEGGQVNIYSETSSASKCVENFKKKYPGIEVEYTKMNSTNQQSVIPQEADSHNAYCDIMISGDMNGEMYNEYYDKGYVTAYYPVCVKNSAWDRNYTKYGVPLSLENYIWFYNKSAFPNGCPVNNWWDIVEKDSNGKSKYNLYTFPFDSANMAAAFSSWAKDPSALEEAYHEKYGKDLEYTYDGSKFDVEDKNAVYEWVYRLMQCNLHYIDDDDQALKALSDSTSDAPVLNFQSGIKLGDAQAGGMNVDICSGLTPINCFGKLKYVYLRTDTDNPCASRLFINYMYGGENYADGNLFVERSGSYSLLNDYDNSKYNTYSLKDLNPNVIDIDYAYDHYLDFEDYAVRNFDELQKK